jgi:hypothetical protein
MFALPLEEKLKFENEKGPKPQRGFSRTGAEVTAVLREKNLTNGLSGYDLKDERVITFGNLARVAAMCLTR